MQEIASYKKIHFARSNKHLQHSITLDNALHRFLSKGINPNIKLHGGRHNAIIQMRTAATSIQHYSKTHNIYFKIYFFAFLDSIVLI